MYSALQIQIRGMGQLASWLESLETFLNPTFSVYKNSLDVYESDKGVEGC